MSTNTTPRTHATITPATASRFNAVDYIALVLLIVGGINWGLVAVANFDLVAAIFGPMTLISRVVYGLVGLAALYGIAMLLRKHRD